MTAILSEYFLTKYKENSGNYATFRTEFSYGQFGKTGNTIAQIVHNGASIVYDIRASLVVKDVVEELGGRAIFNRVGHAYIKKRMKEEGAVFGGEVTGHYYFKDFYGCDSGIVPVIYLLDFLSDYESSLDELVDKYNDKYHISGEINSKVKDVDSVFSRVKDKYAPNARNIIDIDGITIENVDWRFNLRASNTEPLLRLNLEAVSRKLMEEKRDELLELIRK